MNVHAPAIRQCTYLSFPPGCLPARLGGVFLRTSFSLFLSLQNNTHVFLTCSTSVRQVSWLKVSAVTAGLSSPREGKRQRKQWSQVRTHRRGHEWVLGKQHDEL